MVRYALYLLADEDGLLTVPGGDDTCSTTYITHRYNSTLLHDGHHYQDAVPSCTCFDDTQALALVSEGVNHHLAAVGDLIL